MTPTAASLPDTTTSLRPVKPSERIAALDILRGAAMGGVLLAYALWNLGNAPEKSYSAAELALDRMLAALIDTKCYTLLAFLFGLGFALQLTRAEARGGGIVLVYCRRLLALLLIGLAHALLLRNGDILVPYAITGFLLLIFRNAAGWVLALGALGGLVWPYLSRGVWDWTGLPFPARPDAASLGYLAENFAWVRYWYSIGIVQWPASLPLFLCGLYVGKQRYLDRLEAHRRGLRRILIVGLSIGMLAYTSRVWIFPKTAPAIVLGLLWSVHAWGLAACYATAILLLTQSPTWQRRLAALGAVGRMALTHYLLQAALLVPVCLYFSLFDRVTPRVGLLLALAVWSVQLPFSVWWLRRFHFGPAEWVWRSLTYGKPQPLRISASGNSIKTSSQDQITTPS